MLAKSEIHDQHRGVDEFLVRTCQVHLVRDLHAQRVQRAQRGELDRDGRIDALPPDGEAELARDGQRHRQVFLAETIRRSEVGHEFADHPAIDDQRNEGHRLDALIEDGGLEPLVQVRERDVGDRERRGFGIVRGPGRMTRDRRAVAVRQPVPGDELHDAGLIEQQDRGAVAVERRFDGIERRRVDSLGRSRAMQALAELVQRVALAVRGGELAERRAEVFDEERSRGVRTEDPGRCAHVVPLRAIDWRASGSGKSAPQCHSPAHASVGHVRPNAAPRPVRMNTLRPCAFSSRARPMG
jgi:hypothetical protein